MLMLLTSIAQIVDRVLTCFRQPAELSVARHVDVATSIELGWAGVEVDEVTGYLCLVARTGSRSRDWKQELGPEAGATGSRKWEHELESTKMMMEIGWQGAVSGSRQWEGGRFLVSKQRDGKTAKRRREIGATERKNGFKEKEKEVEVDF